MARARAKLVTLVVSLIGGAASGSACGTDAPVRAAAPVRASVALSPPPSSSAAASLRARTAASAAARPNGSPAQPSAVTASSSRAAATAPTAAADRVVLWVGGDVIVPPGMRRAATARFSGDLAAGIAAMMDPLRPFWRADGDAAAVIVNLESPVARTRLLPTAFLHLANGTRLVPSPLNVPREIPEGLRNAGVRWVTLANNHTLDQGRDGLGETLATLRSIGLGYVGAGDGAAAARAPIELGPAGARIAFFSLLEQHAREPRTGPAVGVMGRAALDDVRSARATHDVVVVALHVVAELRERPLRGWRKMVDELIAAGADVVLVHGSHVVGRVTRVESGGRDALVAWGLGNFISEMGRGASPRTIDRPSLEKWDTPRPREELMVRIEVRPSVGRAPDVEVSFLPLWMSHDRDLVERDVIDGPIRHAVLPVAACGSAVTLPESWPEHERAAVARWVDMRRNHLLRSAGLRSPRCDACADDACRAALGPHLLPAPPNLGP